MGAELKKYTTTINTPKTSLEHTDIFFSILTSYLCVTWNEQRDRFTSSLYKYRNSTELSAQKKERKCKVYGHVLRHTAMTSLTWMLRAKQRESCWCRKIRWERSSHTQWCGREFVIYYIFRYLRYTHQHLSASASSGDVGDRDDEFKNFFLHLKN